MNFSLGLTAWRDERSIDDAIRHHDRTGLAVAISLAVSFLATLLKGSKYAQYAAFLDADTVAAVGVLVAGAVAGFGHWAAGGALATAGQLSAPVAGPVGDRAAAGEPHAAAPVGSQPAELSAPSALRNDSFSQPDAGG